MDFKKIRKSSTLYGVVFSILLTLVIFIGLFNFLNDQSSQAGLTLSENYSRTIQELNDSQTRLKTTSDNIKNGLLNVTEPSEGIFSVLNGLRGLSSIFILLPNIADITIQSFQSINGIITQNTPIPNWMVVTTEIALFIFIILLILAVMKGDQQRLV